MNEEILDKIDSVVFGYVNQYATDWTEYDRPRVDRCANTIPFLVMMRPSGVDVLFCAGEYFTMENAFHSQAALPAHNLFLYYDGNSIKSVTRNKAEEICNKVVSFFENRDFPLDGFRKAVERCSDQYSRYPDAHSAIGECGSWKVSYNNRYSNELALEIFFDEKVVARGFRKTHTSSIALEFGRYHNCLSDKTFNEMFDILRSEFPNITRDFDERKRFYALNKDSGR